MDRYIIREDLQLWHLPSGENKCKVQVPSATSVQQVYLQTKIRIDAEPVNEVILYPWRRWYKSEYNIN